jgi:hypothetical protein
MCSRKRSRVARGYRDSHTVCVLLCLSSTESQDGASNRSERQARFASNPAFVLTILLKVQSRLLCFVHLATERKQSMRVVRCLRRRFGLSSIYSDIDLKRKCTR